MFKNPNPSQHIDFLRVSWITHNFVGVHAMSMIFYATLHSYENSFASDSRQKVNILKRLFHDYLSIGDPRSEKC